MIDYQAYGAPSYAIFTNWRNHSINAPGLYFIRSLPMSDGIFYIRDIVMIVAIIGDIKACVCMLSLSIMYQICQSWSAHFGGIHANYPK